MFFFLAVAGMVLFGSGMLGPLMARFLSAPAPLKKIVEEDEEEEELQEHEKASPIEEEPRAELKLQAALSEKNDEEAIWIWNERKSVMPPPAAMLLVDLLRAF